ncbi:hypothetical protein B0H66DRAFT_325570 [Apodospora peruviana]|uniref:Uncharacterized protein n=1 Tax=Apodospora peruviana TaxID=516989 RepID=A0AAE0HYE8_9PEZI|nr:hypothetical protein B0H66DRAFT_325570 [Apodospora peruviana]
MSQLLGQGKSKAAPPSLFLHPSPAASHASLPGIMAAGPGMPGASSSGQRQQQQQKKDHTQQPQLQPPAAAAAALASSSAPAAAVESRRMMGVPGVRSTPGKDAATATTTAGGPGGLNLNIPLQLRRGESTRATDRTDALWAEMQATLEEVELSAGGGTRVFGPDHDRKLGELRMAQIALAQAWARSEADDAIETVGGGGGGNVKGTGVGTAGGGTTEGGGAGTDGTSKTDAGAGGAASATDGGGGGGGAKSTGTAGSVRPGSSGMGGAGGAGTERIGAKMEEETDVDILLARKRREANDRYFQRVNQGVLDVVAKLQEVATAMSAVEQESKDIWGDGDGESASGSAKS